MALRAPAVAAMPTSFTAVVISPLKNTLAARVSKRASPRSLSSARSTFFSPKAAISLVRTRAVKWAVREANPTFGRRRWSGI